MRLTEEENQALLADIAADIPKDFKLIAPWSWMLILTLLALLVGFSSINTALVVILQVLPVHMILLGGLPLLFIVCLVLHFCVVGKSFLARKLILFTAATILASSIILALYLKGNEIWFAIISCLSSMLSLYLINTIQFHAFCLYRKRMGEWGVERTKKNKAFRDKIKKTRQSSSS